LVVRIENRDRSVTPALGAIIRLLAEIVADELLAERHDGAGFPTIQQTPDAMTLREGNPYDHEDLEKPLLHLHS
jgi:hypothetical protein